MDVTMAQVLGALSWIYTDDGSAIWLAAEHRGGPFSGRRPIEVCRTAEGRAEVLSHLRVLGGG